MAFPNVEEFTIELDDKPTGGRKVVSIREASLWNYPNEKDEPLLDHKAWLDLNIVAALRASRMLTCRLFGYASNDKAGVTYNLKVAKRRADRARAYLLGKGVDSRQITKVTGNVDASAPSTSPRDRCVNVYLEQSANDAFQIRRIVPRSRTPVPVGKTPHFFQIRDRENRLDAFYFLARSPAEQPPFLIGPATDFVLADDQGLFDDFRIAPNLAGVQDFQEASMTLDEISSLEGSPTRTLVHIERPQLLASFNMANAKLNFEGGTHIDGTLKLVRGPEESRSP